MHTKVLPSERLVKAFQERISLGEMSLSDVVRSGAQLKLQFAVEQEMAEIYPPTAEDLSEFLPETDCKSCGFSNCVEFAEAVEAVGQHATIGADLADLQIVSLPDCIRQDEGAREIIGAVAGRSEKSERRFRRT